MAIIVCGQDEILGDECVSCGGWRGTQPLGPDPDQPGGAA